MAITAGQTILASDFVAVSAGAADSGKAPKLDGAGVLDETFLPSAKTLMGNHPFVLAATPFAAIGFVTATQMWIAQIVFPVGIVVNKVSFMVSAVAVAGTFKFALYSENGQTLIIPSTTTASVSATGVVTTAVAAISIPAGIYYLAAVPVGTTNINLEGFVRAASNIGELAYQVSSEPDFGGTLVVTADTIPATVDPTAITNVVNGLYARFDN